MSKEPKELEPGGYHQFTLLVYTTTYLKSTFINPHARWGDPIPGPFAAIPKGHVWFHFLLQVCSEMSTTIILTNLPEGKGYGSLRCYALMYIINRDSIFSEFTVILQKLVGCSSRTGRCAPVGMNLPDYSQCSLAAS